MLPEPDLRTPPPEAVEDKKIAAALAEYTRLVAERDAEYTRLATLENDRRKAVELDQQALADSIRAAAEDPGEENTRKPTRPSSRANVAPTPSPSP